MANFQLSAHVPITEMCLDSSAKSGGGQKRITLQQAGWSGGTPLDIGTVNTGIVSITPSPSPGAGLTNFQVEALPGAKGVVNIFARLPASRGGDTQALLQLTVGQVTLQKDFTHDLIAELLGKSEDPQKLWVYQRILSVQNNTLPGRKDWDNLLKDQPLKQITDPDHPSRWNCGAALNHFGTSYFGPDHMVLASTKYYLPPKTTKMADIKFDPAKVRASVKKLKSLIDKGNAVRVFVVHHDGFSIKSGEITQTGHTHFLMIIGYNGKNQFLHVDAWPGGSRLIYNSGIFKPIDSAFMGMLQFDDASGQIRTDPSATRGAHDYLVLMGP